MLASDQIADEIEFLAKTLSLMSAALRAFPPEHSERMLVSQDRRDVSSEKQS
jgi:hypothetical protein